MAFLKWLICHQGQPARGAEVIARGLAAAAKGASFVAHPAHLSPLTESPSYSYSEVAEFRAPPVHLFPFVLVCSISRPSSIKELGKEEEVARHCVPKPLRAELINSSSTEP